MTKGQTVGVLQGKGFNNYGNTQVNLPPTLIIGGSRASMKDKKDLKNVTRANRGAKEIRKILPTGL